MPLRFSSKQFAKTVTDELRVSVVCADTDLRIEGFAPGLGSVVEMDDEALVGCSLLELIPELEGHKESLVNVATGVLPRFGLPRVKRDNRFLSVAALPYEDSDCYVALLVRDVTSEARLEQDTVQQLDDLLLLHGRVEAANRELTRLNEEKTGFMRMAAHDLRNPLTTIEGCLTLVSAQGQDVLEGELGLLLEIAKDSAEQMGRLIDDLLDIEQLESRTMPLRREPVDVSVLVEQVVRSILPCAEQKGLSLEWIIGDGLPHILGDWDRLVQVLGNLVGNAIKYTPPDGSICVEAAAGNKGVNVTIRDTGYGVSEDEQPLLFQRFFRSSDPRLRDVPGTGLGLSIAQAIVHQHGGQITCQSQLGRGSTFRISLPQVPPPISR